MILWAVLLLLALTGWGPALTATAAMGPPAAHWAVTGSVIAAFAAIVVAALLRKGVLGASLRRRSPSGPDPHEAARVEAGHRARRGRLAAAMALALRDHPERVCFMAVYNQEDPLQCLTVVPAGGRALLQVAPRDARAAPALRQLGYAETPDAALYARSLELERPEDLARHLGEFFERVHGVREPWLHVRCHEAALNGWLWEIERTS